jgi:hypothetical protein
MRNSSYISVNKTKLNFRAETGFTYEASRRILLSTQFVVNFNEIQIILELGLNVAYKFQRRTQRDSRIKTKDLSLL